MEQPAAGNYDEDGNQLVGKLELNTESNGRFHTDWLNMIYPRLKLAKDLLSDDGAIFISIDDNELYNLKKICDAVYGESCFVGNVAWQRTYSMRNDSKGLPSEAEHILVYSKQPNWIPNKLPRTVKWMQLIKTLIMIRMVHGKILHHTHQGRELIREWFMLYSIHLQESFFTLHRLLAGDMTRRQCWII